MKKVLVTGAYGFIGRHSLSFLKKAGYEIHTVSRIDRPSVAGITCHQANLLLPGVIDALMKQVKPSPLLHLAWYTEPSQYWTAKENIAWVKISLNLLESFEKQGGKRVVMAGTCAEYDWRYGWCREELTPLNPTTLYGTCKNALQSMLVSFSKQYDLSAAWGRIFFLYGPHENSSRLFPYLMKTLLNSEAARCTAGNHIRDFLHVSDVASAFVALLHSDVQGPVNIASGEALPIKDFIHKVAQKLGRADLIRLGVKQISSAEPALLVANIQRLETEVKWRPEFNLETGLDHAIASWHSQLDRKSVV